MTVACYLACLAKLCACAREVDGVQKRGGRIMAKGAAGHECSQARQEFATSVGQRRFLVAMLGEAWESRADRRSDSRKMKVSQTGKAVVRRWGCSTRRTGR